MYLSRDVSANFKLTSVFPEPPNPYKTRVRCSLVSLDGDKESLSWSSTVLRPVNDELVVLSTI